MDKGQAEPSRQGSGSVPVPGLKIGERFSRVISSPRQVKPLLYVPFGALRDTSPFSVTKEPKQIVSRGCFLFFEDENFYYAVEYTDPQEGEGGIEDLAAKAPWNQTQFAGAKKITSEPELRKTQSQS